MAKRQLKVYEAAGCSTRDIPCIRLQGRWLEELGFRKGCGVVVEENAGRLIIELVKEHPEEYTETVKQKSKQVRK